jgi:hypothetical protein
MRVACIYCCPVAAAGPQHYQLAMRFVASWLLHQPLFDHDLFVISNGGEPSSETEILFSSIDAFRGFHVHNDEGWDIGGFQSIARAIPHEIVVFFGGNAYFKQSGWLKRMINAYDAHGPHLYGAFASIVHAPHIRTTGFWMPRELFNRYPTAVKTNDQRYEFEHRGGSCVCLTEWVQSVGHKALQVTWSGVYGPRDWGLITNGYHNGDQSECLLHDRVCDVVGPPVANIVL